MSAGTLSLLGCIKAVCAAAKRTISAADSAMAVIGRVHLASIGLEARLKSSSTAIQEVVNGPVGTIVDLPMGGRLPTLAEALDRLDATPAIAGITVEQFTATPGQSVFVLATTPASGAHLELILGASPIGDPAGYTLSGATITTAYPVPEGTVMTARIFTL